MILKYLLAFNLATDQLQLYARRLETAEKWYDDDICTKRELVDPPA